MKNKARLVFLSTAVLIEIFLVLFTIINIDGNIPLYMFVYFEMSLLMLLGYYIVTRNIISLNLFPFLINLFKKITSIESDISLPVFIILSGILFRLTLLPATLTTSPDAYRYIWEGKVIVNGYNPFEYEPAHPKLNHLHTKDLPSKINFKEKKAIYPPAAQYIFAAAYLISGESLTGLKLIYLTAEIITMLFLLKLLNLKNKNLNLVILYAWLPLPVLEFFVNAHLDVLGICFLIIFIYILEKEKYYTSSVFFALSFLTKFFPAFLFPLFFKKMGLKKTIIFGSITLIITILFYLPFITGDVNIFSFLLLYLEKWEFNASVYYILKNYFNGETARLLCAFMFVITILVISTRYKNFTKAAAGIFLSFIVFTSTVYPWYLGWIAVLNPVYIYFSAMSFFLTINFSNFTPLGHPWREYYPVFVIEYSIFFVLLGVDLYRIHKNSKP